MGTKLEPKDEELYRRVDEAQTPNGPKVIELNSANSVGFYACDIGAIVDAVERLGLSVR